MPDVRNVAGRFDSVGDDFLDISKMGTRVEAFDVISASSTSGGQKRSRSGTAKASVSHLTRDRVTSLMAGPGSARVHPQPLRRYREVFVQALAGRA